MHHRSVHISRIFLNERIERNLNEYPFTIPVVRNFKHIEFQKPVTFIIGENGTGKSTLVEAFAVCNGFNPEGGSRHFNFNTMSSHSMFYELSAKNASKSKN